MHAAVVLSSQPQSFANCLTAEIMWDRGGRISCRQEEPQWGTVPTEPMFFAACPGLAVMPWGCLLPRDVRCAVLGSL